MPCITGAIGKYRKGVRYWRKSIFGYNSIAADSKNMARNKVATTGPALWGFLIIPDVPTPMVANITCSKKSAIIK